MRERQVQVGITNCAWFALRQAQDAHHEGNGLAAKIVADVKEYGSLQSTHLPHGEPRRTTHYGFATSGRN